jgi:hypothetical protein
MGQAGTAHYATLGQRRKSERNERTLVHLPMLYHSLVRISIVQSKLLLLLHTVAANFLRFFNTYLTWTTTSPAPRPAPAPAPAPTPESAALSCGVMHQVSQHTMGDSAVRSSRSHYKNNPRKRRGRRTCGNARRLATPDFWPPRSGLPSPSSPSRQPRFRGVWEGEQAEVAGSEEAA